MNPENFDKITSGTKNLVYVVIIVVGLAAIFSDSLQKKLGSVLATAGQAGVESLKIGELEFKLRKAEDAVKTLANNPPVASTKPAGDQAPTPTVASALEVINEPGSFWAYVGQVTNGRYTGGPNFKVQGIPNKGDTIVAVTDTNKRDHEPMKIGQVWKLGQIVGVVSEGKPVTVRETKVIEDENVRILAVSGKPPA